MATVGGHPGSVLWGRASECESLDRLLDAVRTGQSSVIVLRGEAGVGKTALLDYVREQATGFRIAHVGGVESEAELAFAGLHQLFAPLLDRLERLPGPQRDALRVAFGLQNGGAPDRFFMGLAVLTLLSEVAAEQPLLCLVDDVQWIDRASVQALAFAARRLLAEPVGIVFSVTEPSDERELVGLPEMLVEGIADSDARRLLASAIRGRLDERVRDRIIAETRGNPLALLELPQGMTPSELAGGFGMPHGRLKSRIEQSFVRRFESVPRETQRFLLTASAEPIGDASLLWRAAGLLGIGADAAAPAEAAGLIELGARVRFRHPLVRSAVYRAASLPDRQEAHRALAEATDPQVDPDRRAWHRASAALGPDESVADELVRSADRAQSRGGIAAAAAFLERATELTPDPALRGLRALTAAEAELEAAAPDRAWELLETAELGPLDELHRARLERLRAQIAFARRRGSDAPPLLMTVAKRLVPLDARLARDAYLEAIGAAVFAGRLSSGRGVLEAAEAARDAPPAPQPPRPLDFLLDGLTIRFTEGFEASIPMLRRAMDAYRQGNGRRDDDAWLWLVCRVAMGMWDDKAWYELSARDVRLARDAGALTALPLSITHRGAVLVHGGEFAAASALYDEANAIIQVTGMPSLMYTSLVLSAWRGREAETVEIVETSAQDATARGEGRAITIADYSMAVLYNGLGRYDAALAAAQRACSYDDLGLFGWSLIELIEAAARSGRPELAADALQQLVVRTQASGTEWALGVEARSRALLSEGQTADALYQEAIDRLSRSRIGAHLVRAQLLYGEWLRRVNRRVDAREQLRIAHDTLSHIGATAFAERARRELQATGETVRRPAAHALHELTAQEAQIARLARDGRTNPEIAAQLFLSPRTVEWHLRKVFTKLDISSRKELRNALPESTRDTTTQ